MIRLALCAGELIRLDADAKAGRPFGDPSDISWKDRDSCPDCVKCRRRDGFGCRRHDGSFEVFRRFADVRTDPSSFAYGLPIIPEARLIFLYQKQQDERASRLAAARSHETLEKAALVEILGKMRENDWYLSDCQGHIGWLIENYEREKVAT